MRILIKLFPVDENPYGLLANVSLTLCDVMHDGKQIEAFAVSKVTVKNGKKGMFVSMPSISKKKEDGNMEYQDVFYPITKEARGELVDTIFSMVNTGETEMAFDFGGTENMYYTISVKPLKEAEGKTKAYGRINFFGQFIVDHIRIVEGKNGLFVSYPSYTYKNKDGETKSKSYVFPLDETWRDAMTADFLKCFEEAKTVLQ